MRNTGDMPGRTGVLTQAPPGPGVLLLPLRQREEGLESRVGHPPLPSLQRSKPVALPLCTLEVRVLYPSDWPEARRTQVEDAIQLDLKLAYAYLRDRVNLTDSSLRLEVVRGIDEEVGK